MRLDAVTTQRRDITGALCKLGVQRLAEGTMFLVSFSTYDIICE